MICEEQIVDIRLRMMKPKPDKQKTLIAVARKGAISKGCLNDLARSLSFDGHQRQTFGCPDANLDQYRYSGLRGDTQRGDLIGAVDAHDWSRIARVAVCHSGRRYIRFGSAATA